MKIHLNTLTFILILIFVAGCGTPEVRQAETQPELEQPAPTEALPTESVPTEPPNTPTPTIEPTVEVVTATPTAAPTVTPPVRGDSDLMFTFADKRCTYEGPEVLSSGNTSVIMNMQGLDKYKTANTVLFFTIDPDYELKDLIDSIWMPSPPEWAHLIYLREAKPGEVAVHDITVESGPLYFICLSGESEETTKLVGKGGPLEVSP